ERVAAMLDYGRFYTPLLSQPRAIPTRASPTSPGALTSTSGRLSRPARWRAGRDGRIGYLKRCHGFDRSRLDGRERAATWCGYGVLAHILVKACASTAPAAQFRRPVAMASQDGGLNICHTGC